MSIDIKTAIALAEAWNDIHPGKDPTPEDMLDFVYECAYIGAQSIRECKELTEQKQD